MKASDPETATARCLAPCGKLPYIRRRAAKLAIRQMRGCGHGDSHLTVYRCRAAREFFHIGTLPAPVIAGEIGRDDIRRPA